MINVNDLTEVEIELVFRDVESSDLNEITKLIVQNIIQKFYEKDCPTVGLTDIPPRDDVELP